MKKTKKALASLAIAGMALTMVPFNAFAASTVPTRLAGGTAAQTAVAIAEQTGWTGTAILASSASYGMVDALTSGPLATFLKAPILLQEPGAVLNADTKAELAKLNVKKVYVTSGTSVISQAVLDQMSGMGITVESLGGADRFETSVNIAKKMVALGAPVSKVAVAYGWLNQDALSIASIASASSSPILLTEKNALPASVQAFLTANTSVTASDVIGGTGVISDAVKAALPNATRHAGNTAYDTNNQVIQDFSSSLTYGNVFVASGVTGIDALAGAPLAAASKSPIVLTDGTVPAAATFVHSKLATDSVVTALGGSAVVPDAVRTGVITGVVTPSVGALAVTSVSAASINGIKVVFNHAPADTSKVTFTVTRTSSPATVTATWNDAKTEATLTSSGNYAEGDYIVAVADGATSLGTSNVSFTAQRVGKIAVDSNVLAVTSSGAIGYAGYHVYDQYGTDITTSYLAGDSYIQWNCGVGNVVSNGKGLLTVKPFTTSAILTQYQTAVVTAVTQNQTIPASVNTTLNISTTQGTISDITLNKLTSPDNSIPTVGDTEKYYIDYTAKDMAGNATVNKTLVQQGLITNNVPDDYSLITSNSTLVTAKIVEDPSDDQKAVIEVSILDPQNYTLMQDQPITITASTYTGKTSSMTFTLRRKQAVDTFTMMAPTSNIPSGKTGVVIPYAAYDQAGKALTKMSDLKGLLTLSPNDSNSTASAGYLYLDENADGTASLKYDAPTVSGTTSEQHTITASVAATGKFSSLTLNVDVAAKVDSLKLDDSVVIPRMEIGSVQSLDFGFNDGGFRVVDQYGADIDMTSKSKFGGTQYFVRATSSNPSVVSIASNDAYAGHEVKLSGNTAGTATVKFELMGTTDNFATVVDQNLSKSLSVSVLTDKDITGYVLDTVAKPLYAIATTSGAITAQQEDFNTAAQEPYVYGTTTSGGKVVVKTSNIISRTVSSSDFLTIADTNQTEVIARAFTDSAKKGSSATLTVTVMNDYDNRPHTATTPVTSITDDAVAQSMGFYAQTVDRADKQNATGITFDGSTVTVSMSGTQSYYSALSTNAAAINSSTPGSITSTGILNAIVGRDLTRFTAADGSSTNRGYIYLWAKDQYGSKAMNLSNLRIVQENNAAGVAITNSSVVNNTLQMVRKPNVGDYVYISGISSNGLVTTIKIVFKA